MYTNIMGKCFVLLVSAIIIQSVFQASICFPAGEIQARVSEKAMKEKWARVVSDLTAELHKMIRRQMSQRGRGHVEALVIETLAI